MLIHVHTQVHFHSCLRIHAQWYTHNHICMHTLKHTNSQNTHICTQYCHSLMFIGSHLHTDTLILTHMHTLTVSYIVTYLQTYTHSLTHTVTLTCTLTLSRGHTLINIYSHTRMYILKRTHNTHSHTHSNTLMHMFSHIHEHSQSIIFSV